MTRTGRRWSTPPPLASAGTRMSSSIRCRASARIVCFRGFFGAPRGRCGADFSFGFRFGLVSFAISAATCAASAAIGLVHTITVDEDRRLLAGARRLAACKLLGLQQVEVRIMRANGR
jgi:hypothetical protein